MVQKTSPFLEGKYGWDLGESGWNGGMDENLLKFSYLFDNNVDQIVSTLPGVVSNGAAYFLTSDNRLYFVVGGAYYSSPVPKWFTFKVRSTGDSWQFNGTSLVQLPLLTDLNTRLTTAESSLNTIGSGPFVKEIVDIAALRLYAGAHDGQLVKTSQYSSSRPGVGGSTYKWKASSTSVANNCTVIQVTGVPTGRWLIELTGALLATQGGAIPDYSGSSGTDNRVRLNEIINAWPHVVIDGHFGITFDTDNFGAGLIMLNDNSTLEFSSAGKISALAHNNTIYQMIRIWDRTNCKIIRANLDGRKDLNSAPTGEFGMGIDLRGGSGNRIEGGAACNNMWGDGFYIGHSSNTGTTKNTWIESPSANACRRQGMSIVSASVLDVFSPYFTNISGTAPAAGIDIEPDDNSEILNGIRIHNPVTINCAGPGILVYLGAYSGPIYRDVDIKIYGHQDFGSVVGASIGGGRSTVNGVKGKITIDQPTWSNSKQSAFTSVEHGSDSCVIEVIRPTVIDPNRDNGVSLVFNSIFSVYRPGGSVLTYPIGNVIITEPSIEFTSGQAPTIAAFDDQNATATNVINCHFIDPVKLVGVTNQRAFFQGMGTISSKYNNWTYTPAGSTTLDSSQVAPISFPNLSGTTFTLGAGAFVKGSPDIIIDSPNVGTYTVSGSAAGQFIGLAGTVVSLRSTTPGSRLRLRPMGSNTYLIIERQGLWTEI